MILDAHDLARFGPLLENHPIFPDRANISLAQVISPSRIRLKVWERGAGLTQACGSAACATLVAAARRKFTGREATVSLPGGDLDIVWRESDSHVLMTGPVENGMGRPVSGGYLPPAPPECASPHTCGQVRRMARRKDHRIMCRLSGSAGSGITTHEH